MTSKRPTDAAERPASPKRRRAEPQALGFRLREAPVAMAAAFRPTHASWEAFEAALKEYAQATCQLYVVRTTTSVRRRNQRIAEALMGGPAPRGEEDGAVAARVFIPERFEWYSKTFVCTHGWKDRHRGSGKRAMASVRSTSCPARMCVTLQRRDVADWEVVVTKHVRSHNHPLSKELFLYYTENRRIYDPELLAVLGDGQPADPAPFSATQEPPQEMNDGGDDRQIDTSIQNDSQLQGGIAPLLGDNTVTGGSGRTELTVAQLIADAAGNELSIQGPNRFVQAPRVDVKTHESWEAFHCYIVEYSKSTNQVFRTRSTISVSAKNAKTKERAVKTGRPKEETGALELPTDLKWYSKMLICNHGWKRKSRSKSLRNPYPGASDLLFGGQGESGGKDTSATNQDVCPAMLLARLERDIHDNWRVVINRQVVEHNHSLSAEMYDNELAVITPSALLESSATPAEGTDLSSPQTAHPVDNASLLYQRPPTVDGSEVVVRVPRLQAVFSSWEDFHAKLKLYSDETYQLYCTRTTTSVECRNRKIVAMQEQAEAEKNNDVTVAGAIASPSNNVGDIRLIPEEWKWYNKTLMCTHGWKRRPRGQGKRTAHVVRSTLCPVKLCATVQYIEPVSVGDRGGATQSIGGWRVVITRHVVDHNHNLSSELYEHYRENRRIYDPELLTIDEGNEGAIVKRKAGGISLDVQPSMYGLDPTREAVGNVATDTTLDTSPDNLHSATTQLIETSASMGIETISDSPSSMDDEVSNAHILPARIHSGSHPVPSVVILPYQSSTPDGVSMAMDSTSRISSGGLASIVSTTASTGDGVAALTALAAPQSQVFVPYHLPESGTRNEVGNARHSHPSMMNSHLGNNLFTMVCPVHGGNTSDEGEQSGVSCTCFRLAGSAQYVTIAPSRVSQLQTSQQTLSYDLGDGNVAHENFADTASSALMGEGSADPDLDLTADAWTLGTPVEIPPPVVLDTGETLWRVPAMVRRHTDWDSFHKYLDAYSSATFQLFSVRTTTSVRSRYARIAQQMSKKQADQPQDAPLSQQQLEQLEQVMPADFEWYSKTFLCTHGWKRRRRGVGKRVGHNVRSTQCPAKLCATLQRSAYGPDGTKGPKRWCVVVTKQIFDHNHELSEAAYQRYSENRRIKDPEVLQEAEALWRSGSTRREVFEYLKERVPSVAIVMKDVHNIVQRWKAKDSRGAPTSAGDEGVGQDTPLPVVTSPKNG